MGSVANPRLAAAVANAGGLGMVSVYGNFGGPPGNIVEMLEDTRDHTTGVFGANFLKTDIEEEGIRESVEAAAAHAPVVEFFYCEPDPRLIEIVHIGGALACWQVGSRAEAVAAVDAGCDFIIAQGIGAGGHIRGTIGLLALLDQVLEAVDVPVVAAGGIGSGRAMAAALVAGADGVRVGTRFLAVEEADIHNAYFNALIAAEAQDTVYTEAYSTNWPNAPHRVLKSCVDAAQTFDEGEIVGTVADTWNDEPYESQRFQPHLIHKSATGTIAAMPHWAGESVGGVKQVQTAAEIIEEMAGEAERLLRRWS
jgi:NAD(P)H-dependent flavin oxidoreductase YrpB (nitropropane dioxygenase family)